MFAYCFAHVRYRCLFDMEKFVSDNSLHLVGMSVMRAQRSAYVRYARGDAEGDVCPDALPCDESNDDSSSASDVSKPMIAMLVAACVIAYVNQFVTLQ